MICCGWSVYYVLAVVLCDFSVKVELLVFYYTLEHSSLCIFKTCFIRFECVDYVNICLLFTGHGCPFCTTFRDFCFFLFLFIITVLKN